MFFDGEPLVICAEARPDSLAVPFTTVRECEGCGVEVLASPASVTMIEDGAHPCCLVCGTLAQALLQGEDAAYELVPGALAEVTATLGPEAAQRVEALVDSMNKAVRRQRN